MARVEFDGQGTPIPKIALPPFGGDDDLPPTVLIFNNSIDFPVTQYEELGFTHFEVWCVGAAGGRGGNVSTQMFYVDESVYRPVPQDVWNLRLEQIRVQDRITTGVWDYLYSYGSGPWGPGPVQLTAWQAEEWQNPEHRMTFRTYRQVLLYPTVQAIGGAGGGGGMHKESGLLSDLPDVTPIIVGQAGADKGYGHIQQVGVWTPPMDPLLITPAPPHPDPNQNRVNEISNYFKTYLYSYPPPQSSYSNPQAGGDGGVSSFAGDICRASGGKGGNPGMVWNGSAFVINGNGGQGGLGGRTLAGGGGAGSTALGVNGSDGTWIPETGIGGGGGGGKGGRPPTVIPAGPGGSPPATSTPNPATAGGQGSYSFGDTSVYGQRGFRGPWTYQKPTTVIGSGTVTYVPTTDTNFLITPGAGGGARPLKTLKHGSYATGYSPNGVVVLRLTRIV